MLMKVLSVIVLLLSVGLYSCQESNKLQIVLSDDASGLEQITAEDLKNDLELVVDREVQIVSEATFIKNAPSILLGTFTSNQLIKNSLKSLGVDLQVLPPRAGLWQKFDDNQIVLAGSDEQGLQYAVYDYSKEVLGIDPLLHWTGHVVDSIQIDQVFNLPNRIIDAPKVPLLVYFENDVDELANLNEPLLEYDWESYTEMIDALVRLRYNGIQLFDMLGRPEFYRRDAYKKLKPDYQVRLSYLDSLIDYAHLKGMKVQVDMALGYQIKPLDQQYADCWVNNKDKWIDTWGYYLTQTPIGKADIFALRPRNQVWDWEYKSSCGEDKIQVFNEVYTVLDSVIDQHKPDADKVVICYADGMEMFNQGFTPPKDWVIAWSDDGYARFDYLPDSTRGYQFGTYMHAGFWKNHTVADPYAGRIDTIMHHMFDEYGATAYCEVNGQQFRPFLLNIEAFSEVCRDPDHYDGYGFYRKWTKRYLPDTLSETFIKTLNLWHKASFGKSGYVEELWGIKNTLLYLAAEESESSKYAQHVEPTLIDAADRLVLMKEVLYEAGNLLPYAPKGSYHFHDQVYFPIKMYRELLAFERVLHQLYRIRKTYMETKNPNLIKQANVMMKSARLQLNVVYELRTSGDQNLRWKGWYDLKKRRPNNGFPTHAMLDEIEEAIKTKW